MIYTKNGTKCYHHIDLDVTDKELNQFIKLLKIDIEAQDYTTQLHEVINNLKNVFNCSDFEAEHYFYNNALKLIKEISVETDEVKRKITKRAFLNKINKKTVLFNQWFIEYKGLEKCFKELRKNYFSALNTSPFDRFFLIEINNDSYQRTELKELILIISRKWTKISNRTNTPFCPYIYVEGIDNKELIGLKQELFSEGYIFIDGFDFLGANFSVKSMTKKPNINNGIQFKIINKKSFIEDIIKESSATKEIFQFYRINPFYDNDSENLKHIKIQIGELKYIKEII